MLIINFLKKPAWPPRVETVGASPHILWVEGHSCRLISISPAIRAWLYLDETRPSHSEGHLFQLTLGKALVDHPKFSDLH